MYFTGKFCRNKLQSAQTTVKPHISKHGVIILLNCLVLYRIRTEREKKQLRSIIFHNIKSVGSLF